MPTYEYLCQTCSHRFETWQKMVDEPLTVCPECGGHIRRVLYPAGIVFKGSGFYKTDYGNGTVASPTNGESKNGEAKNGESTKAEGTGEKPASSESKSSESSSSASSSTTASTTSAGSGTK